MTRLMEQKAGEQQSAYGKAELPSANADAEEDAEENQEPACAVHAERDSEFQHGIDPR